MLGGAWKKTELLKLSLELGAPLTPNYEDLTPRFPARPHTFAVGAKEAIETFPYIPA